MTSQIKTASKADGAMHDTQFIMQRLVRNGWRYVAGRDLKRGTSDVILAGSLLEAIQRINPTLSLHQGVDPAEVIPKIQGVIRHTDERSLVKSNRMLSEWMKKGVPTPSGAKIRILDHSLLSNNELVVSDNVVFTNKQGIETQLDLVLWVNGIPLAVGETKDDNGDSWIGTDSQGGAWTNAAESIHSHEKAAPEFFASNVVSFAIGRDEIELSSMEFRFGAIGCPVEKWERWGSTADPFNLDGKARVERSIELLLNQTRLLSIITDFTLYGNLEKGAQGVPFKVTPRYPQVEAVEAIHRRALEPGRKQGLVVQHQGTGKTLAMVFASIKLYHESALNKATIVVIADRNDLVDQTFRQFKDVGVPNVYKPNNAPALASLISSKNQQVIITTIHKFGGVKTVNISDNIIVLIDEAHRTQEGTYGDDLRRALPNARFFGFTGTPIADKDRNTFRLFGDPNDEGWVINQYLQERSIADGTVVRIKIDSRAVKFHLSDDVINAEYDRIVEEEGVDASQTKKLIQKAEQALVSSPERIKGVCEFIIDHFYDHIDPNGMKAQIVAPSREMCVAYDREIKSILEQRGRQDESAVVMSYDKKTDDRRGWQSYNVNDKQVGMITKRFNNFHDSLKFLIVNNMLTTGFDAPIEGAMYLDRDMSGHNLFQTISRVNRKWQNPTTGWRKPHGVVVDLVGLGEEIPNALAPVSPDATTEDVSSSVDDEFNRFEGIMGTCLDYFTGLRKDPSSEESVTAGAAIISVDSGKLHYFVREVGRAVDIWEALYPDSKLERHARSYKWLVNVYHEVIPKDAANQELMNRLGAKTLELIHSNIKDVRVDQVTPDLAVIDADAIVKLREFGIELRKSQEETSDDSLHEETSEGSANNLTLRDAAEAVMGHIDRADLFDDQDSPYTSIGDRLRAIYEQYLEHTVDAAKMLREILGAAQEVSEVTEDLLTFEQERELALPVLLQNLITGVDDISREKMAEEVHGLVADLLQRPEEGMVESAEAGVHEITGLYGVSEETEWIVPVLVGFVVESVNALTQAGAAEVPSRPSRGRRVAAERAV